MAYWKVHDLLYAGRDIVLFPDFEDNPRVRGTAGEVLELIADLMGIEDEDADNVDFALDGIYPSTRAYRAQQAMEDRLPNPDNIFGPEDVINALMKEGLVRSMSDDEYEEWQDENEMEEYEEERGGLDEEWQDGLWET